MCRLWVGLWSSVPCIGLYRDEDVKREDSLGLGHVEAHAEDAPNVVMRRRSSGRTSEVCTI